MPTYWYLSSTNKCQPTGVCPVVTYVNTNMSTYWYLPNTNICQLTGICPILTHANLLVFAQY